MSYQIAIDGPAGAGKSTIAKAAAKKLSYIYVDTGAMYRAIALYLLREGVDAEDTETISRRCSEAEVSIGYEDGVQVVYLNGENVNSLIRTEEVGSMASHSSAVPAVRARLLDLQRDLAEKNNVLMDGRDIGTTVLPNATAKIFLTASSLVRARRRKAEYDLQGVEISLEEVERKILERDYDDSHRAVSPLVQAADAVLLDTSDLTIDQAVAAVIDICQEKGCR